MNSFNTLILFTNKKLLTRNLTSFGKCYTHTAKWGIVESGKGKATIKFAWCLLQGWSAGWRDEDVMQRKESLQGQRKGTKVFLEGAEENEWFVFLNFDT